MAELGNFEKMAIENARWQFVSSVGLSLKKCNDLSDILELFSDKSFYDRKVKAMMQAVASDGVAAEDLFAVPAMEFSWVKTFLEIPDNPWYYDGMDTDADTFMAYGPKTSPAPVWKYPDLMVAFGYWAKDHPLFNPAVYQAVANQIWTDSEGSFSQSDIIRLYDCYKKRASVETMWAGLFQKISKAVGGFYGEEKET